MGVVRLVGGHVTYRCAVRGTEAGPVAGFLNRDDSVAVLLQCLFSRLISIFPQGGRMVFPGLVIMQSVM